MSELDQKLHDRLKALADKQRTKPEELVQSVIENYVEAQEHYWLEREEDESRLENCKSTGGIPHEQVSEWLRTVGTDSPIPCPEK